MDYEDDPDTLKPAVVPDDDGDTEYEDVSHAAEESSQPPDEEEGPVKLVKVKDVPVKMVKIKVGASSVFTFDSSVQNNMAKYDIMQRNALDFHGHQPERSGLPSQIRLFQPLAA